MLSEEIRSYADDLGIDMTLDPRTMVAVLVACGFGLMVLGGRLCTPIDCPEIYILSTACYALAACVWALCSSHQNMARWVIAIFFGCLSYCLCVWLLGYRGAALLLLAIALSACILGNRGPLGLALFISVMLLWDPGAVFEGERSALSVTLASIWLMPLILFLVRRPMARLVEWSWRYGQMARTALDQARDRQVELQEALRDLADANAQMGVLNNKLIELREDAEQARRIKTAFLSKVSHEFRTPLNMIIGLTDIALESPEVYGEALSGRLREHLEIVNRNCEHLASLVNDVLDLSQVDTGRLTIHRERLDLCAIVDKGVQIVRPLVEQKGLVLEVKMAPDLPTAYCDRTRIAQVIVNLLSNAARYTDKGGITVSGECTGDEIVVSVRDTGLGIAQDDLAMIFEPFCQGVTDRPRDRGGSGLGLSVSKQFVELHGGRIWVESELGRGSTFFFTLPLTSPQPIRGRPGHWIVPELIERGPRRPRSTAPRDRVVVCDLGDGLATMSNHAIDSVDVHLVHDLETLEKELPHLPCHAVLINADSCSKMISAASAVRDIVPETPVFATCVQSPTNRALAAGAEGYLLKPVSRKQLEAVLGRQTHRVLVVDDEPDELELFALQLAAIDPKFEIIGVQGGAEALDVLGSEAVDLVLLDIVMPMMDGWSVLAAMRSDPALVRVPVWIVSAEDPLEGPPSSELLLSTIGGGFSVHRLLDLVLPWSARIRGATIGPEGASV